MTVWCSKRCISCRETHTHTDARLCQQWLAVVEGCTVLSTSPLPFHTLTHWTGVTVSSPCPVGAGSHACVPLRPFPKHHLWIKPLSTWQSAEPGLIPNKKKQWNRVTINCKDWKSEVWGEAIACTKPKERLPQDSSDWLVCRPAPTSIPQSTLRWRARHTATAVVSNADLM